MSRVSKKRLLEILKGEDTVPTNVWEWFSKPISQERWLKEYKKWKKDQEKISAKNKRTHS